MGRRLAGTIVALIVLTACGADDQPTPTGADAEYEGTASLVQQPGGEPTLCVWTPCEAAALPVVGVDWELVDDEVVGPDGSTSAYVHVVGTYGPDGLTLTQPPGPPEEAADAPDDDDVAPACEEPDVVDPAEGAAEWEEAVAGAGEPFDPPDLVAAWVSDPAGAWDGPFVGSLVVLPGSADEALAEVRERYAGPVCVVEREAATASELAAIQAELDDAEAVAALRPIGVSADERRGVVVAEVWVADAAALDYATERWGELVELAPALGTGLVTVHVDGDLTRVDWAAAKAALAADAFDNGRTPDALRRSFEQSQHVALAWDDDELVGMGRLLSDGVCNAYLVDVWTDSRHRRQGIGTQLVRYLLVLVAGQHVGLQTDDAQRFYGTLGFRSQPEFLSIVVGDWLDNDANR